MIPWPVLFLLLLLHLSCDRSTGSKAKPPDQGKSKAEQNLDPMVHALLKRAEWAIENGAYATALAICDQIDKKASSLEYVYFLRGQALTSLNRHEEAGIAFEKVAEINPNFPAIYFNLGNNAFHRGQYHEALEYYQAEQNAVLPGDPLVKKRATLLQLGKVYKALGEIDSARAVFNRVVQLDNNFDEAYDELGLIYQEEGELEKALVAKMRALELKPENADYSYYVGTLLFQLDRPEEAIPHLEKSREKRPWFYGAYYNLGRSLIAIGQTKKGREYLSIADSLQIRNAQLGVVKTSAQLQNTANGWMNYANLLYRDERYEEALEAYQIAHSLNPRDSVAAQTALRLKRALTRR